MSLVSRLVCRWLEAASFGGMVGTEGITEGAQELAAQIEMPSLKQRMPICPSPCASKLYSRHCGLHIVVSGRFHAVNLLGSRGQRCQAPPWVKRCLTVLPEPSCWFYPTSEHAMKTSNAVFLGLSAAALVFALWQIAFSGESLAGLWLIFWAITFLPILLVRAAVYVWRTSRLRARQ